MIKMTHLAAQYLAAAGISFLDAKDDDSHTSLFFDTKEGKLSTWPLNEKGSRLSLNYHTFGLEWDTREGTEFYSLDGCTHDEVFGWILNQSFKSFIKKPYVYNFHYELPYQIADSFEFKLDKEKLRNELGYRTLAQLAIRKFLEEVNLDSGIRVWPHHFDTGAYIPKIGNKEQFSMGLGLAIPDGVHSDFYFYLAFYDELGSLPAIGYPRLTKGKWMNLGFKGAILPAAYAIDKSTVVQFFEEAYDIFLTKSET